MNEQSFTVVIKRPIKQVFEYVANPHTVLEWQQDVDSIEIQGDELAAGVMVHEKRRYLNQPINTSYTISRYEPHSEYWLSSKISFIKYEAGASFEEVDGGTQVTLVFRIDMSGFTKVMAPMVLQRFSRQYEQNVVRLKEILEAKPE